MSDERFSEAEIRQVFEHAAAAQARAGQAAPAGLTLDEMAEVGEASGIPRALVEAAARAVRRGAPESQRTGLGPVATGVSRSVPLDAPPSDALWERLVADARRTFDARGRAETAGGVREWRNGNLRMTLEPAGDGSRLTLRSDRRSSTVGLVSAALVQAVVGVLMLTGGVADDGAPLVGMGAVFLMVAAALLIAAWTRQRGWADTREQQMTRLTERAVAASEQTAPEQTASEHAAVASRTPDTGRAGGPRLDLGQRLDLDALGDDPEPEARRARRRGRA